MISSTNLMTHDRFLVVGKYNGEIFGLPKGSTIMIEQLEFISRHEAEAVQGFDGIKAGIISISSSYGVDRHAILAHHRHPV